MRGAQRGRPAGGLTLTLTLTLTLILILTLTLTLPLPLPLPLTQVGNVVNIAPEMFCACIGGVPFVDLMVPV